MKNFINSLNEKVIIINYSGKILFSNHMLLNKLGFNLSEIIDTNISQLIFEKDFSIDVIQKNINEEYIFNFKTKNRASIKSKIKCSLGSWQDTPSIFIVVTELLCENYTKEDLKDILNSSFILDWVKDLSTDVTTHTELEKIIYQSYEQLDTLKYILDKNNYTVKHSRLLDSIKNKILKTLKCDEFHIWTYSDGYLFPYATSTVSDAALDNVKSIKYPSESFYEKVYNFSDWGIKETFNTDPYLVDILSKTKLKYLGVYPVTFNDEIIGLFYVGYKNNYPSLLNQDQFIYTLCKQLGLSMKNYTLSESLKKEFKRRHEIEKELSFLLNTASDITSILKRDGSFEKVNEGWSKLLGYTEEELLTKKWTDIIHPKDITFTSEFLNDKIINSSSIKEISNRQISKSGEIRWFKWSCTYLKDEDILLTTGKDITEEKKLEKQKKVMEESLHIENIKNEFFANISHEFKTPLNIILACIQVINNNINTENITTSKSFDLFKYITSIKQNSYRLLRLANNLIDITKIDTGYYEIHPKNCNIVSIIENITVSVAEYIKNRGIDIIFDTDTEEQIISCDPEKIERIMLNLLSNAVKYTSCKGQIDVNLKTTNDKVIISVKDNGIGIPKENLDIIFKRFMQVDDTLTRKCEGSGIGLSLVESLVKMHNGEIYALSKENLGTEIIFTLPLVTIDDAEIIYDLNDFSHNKIEKCNIEFSDIYNL